MNNADFWSALKANWSTLQVQASDTKFDSELLKNKIQKQIKVAKKIRQTHYRNNEFLDSLDYEEDE